MDYMKDILVKEENYLPVNKTMIRKLGLNEALFLTNLIYAEKGTTQPQQKFFQTVNTVQVHIGMKRRQQENVIKTLIAKKLITKHIEGYADSARRYFTLNYSNILKFCTFTEDAILDKNGYLMQMILDGGGYWILSKTIITKLNPVSALLLTILSEAELHFEQNKGGDIIENVNSLELFSGMTRYYQSKAIKELSMWDFITVNNKIIDGDKNRVMRLNYDAILTLIKVI